MKKIAPEVSFTGEQLNKIAALAKDVGLCEQTVSILYGRGIDTADKIKAFIRPSKAQFLNPFLMSGMKEAVELLNLARDEGWSVAVFGDYDADGICATTIMKHVLEDYGIDVHVFIPERKSGYGLNIEAVDHVFEECFPQLFITVDCGISNYAEVEYIKEQGAEVIVTDHHELPERLPDSICINPKIADDYPYDNLCGAGVAFKVGCALLGSAAYKYIDFAAIATIADSVSLTGENRAITAEGLKFINNGPRANYAGFINKPGEKITAQNITFSIVPKINAAGRMGDANLALQLFLSEDEGEIFDLTAKLTAYNIERQKCCDELYASAKQKIKQKGAEGRVIVLWDEDWNTGFVGIVAARLAEEYCRPALLFVKNGELLKGSARSIDGVNVFEGLKACSDLITEFGGHSQAAGINLELANLAELERRLNEFFSEKYTQDAFTPTYYVNGETSQPYSERFLKELELFEPCGVGNRKPQFAIDVSACTVRPSKFGSPHVAVRSGGLDLMYFSGVKYKNLLKCPINKRLLCDYSVSVFRGREQIKGYVRDVVYSYDRPELAAEEAAFNTITRLAMEEVNFVRRDITLRKANDALKNSADSGTVFIACDPSTLEKYDIGGTEVNFFTLSAACLSKVIIVSPLAVCDLSAYERVVYLDDPGRVTLPSLDGKTVEICKEISGVNCINNLSCEREDLLSVFKILSAEGEDMFGYDFEDFVESNELGCPSLQGMFALRVFEELNLIEFAEGKIYTLKGIKTQLTNSELYSFVLNYENGNR